jgi:hypothetical protein
MKLLPLALAAAMSAAAFGSAQPALAQNGDGHSNGYSGGSQTTGAASDDDSDSGDYRDRGRDEGRGPDGWRDRDGALLHRWMMDMMGRGPHRAPPSAGATFRFQHGRDRVDIRCPPQQSLDDCVRAAGRLMRELAAMKHAASHDEDGRDGTDGKGSDISPGMSPGHPGAGGPAGDPGTGGSRPGVTTTPGAAGTPDDAEPGTGDRL